MRQLNKQRVKNGNKCIPEKSSKRNFVRKKNKKFRSKTIQNKKLTKKYIKKKFLCKDRKFRKKGFWLNNIFLDNFRDQDYKYVKCNAPCLECSKCGFISSRIKCLHKHSGKHYDLKTPTRTLQLKKSILKCSYCPHVHTKLTDLLKHVQYAHLEKKDYKKNKIDTLKKKLKEIYFNIKNLNLELSALNLCHERDKTDKLSDSGNIDVGKSRVCEHISNISSESVSMPPKFNTDGIKSNSKISTRTYSSVCKMPSEIKFISDNNNKNIHNKTEFVSAATLPKKPLHQQVKLAVHVEKTQQYVPTVLKKEKSSSKSIRTACNICSTKFPNTEDLKRHEESGAHDKMTFVCPTCSSVFSDIKDLKKHRKKTKHKKIKLLCSVCFSLFPSKYEIDLHIKSTRHRTINKVTTGSVLCLTCNSIFSSKNMLDQHVLKSHTDSVNSISSLCGSTSGTKNALDQQKPKAKQEVGNHLCTICLKGFNSRAHLNDHMKNGVHETVGSSIQRMSTKKCLQSPTIHAEQKPENEFINLRQFLRNTNQNITCTLCRRQFPTEENLKEHMESDSHNSLSACVHNITLQTPKIGIEEHSNNKQKLKDNLQEQPITNAWQEQRNIVSLNQSTKVEEHSTSVHEVTSNKNSIGHDDIALDGQKSVNVVFASELNDVKPQLETVVTKRFLCTICQKEFAAEIDLEQHMNSKVLKHKTTSFSIQEIAADENLIELPISNVGQESRQIISASELTVGGQNSGNTNHKKVTCTVCYKQFAAEVSLHQHMEHIHKSHSAYVHEVTTAKNSLDQDITLDEHKSVNVVFASELNDVKPQLETAVTKRFICTICQKEFAAEIDLEQHMNSKVLKHRTSSFSIQKVAADENLIEQPISNVEQAARNIFASEFTDVGQESRSNKPKKTTCPVCYKQFAAEVSLKQHIENTHKSLSTPVHEITSNKKSLEHAITLDRQKSENLFSVSNVGQESGSSAQRKIACTLCQKQFSDEESLKQHMGSSVHKTIPSFGVNIDNNSQKQHTNHNTQKQENISSVSDVGQEVGSSKQRKINCTLCHKQFSDEASLKQHMGSSVHKTIPSFGFPIDNNSQKQHTNHNTQKQENISLSHVGKITCTLCQKQFSDEASLKQHMGSSVHKTVPSFGFPIDNNSQKQHTNHNTQKQENISSVSDVGQEVGSSKQRKINCTLCHKQFSDEASLKQHMGSSVHKTIPSFGFPIDNNSQKQHTNHNTQKQENISLSHVGKITCTLCQKQFSDEESLKQHMGSSVHKTVPSFGFPIDNNSQKQHTNHNTQKQENISSVSDVGQEVGSSKQRKINCTLCHKQFSDEASLKQHMGSSVHKTIPSFGFPIDNNSQKQHTNHNTQKQENISSVSDVGQEVGSSKQRKINCTLCHKQFSDEASLKQHMGSSVHKTIPSFGFPIDNNSQKQHTNHNTQKQENISSVSDVGQEVGSSKQRKINCTLCHKQFSDEASLKQHMGSSVHKTIPSFGFPIDNNSQKQHTNHNTQKQENISLSHVGKITCTLCQKQFSDEASLKQHMGSSVHKTVPSFGFPIDNNSQKQHTNHNTQKQENISSVSDVGQEVGSSKQRKINCTLCHKQFSDEASLKQHMGSSVHKTIPSFGFPIDNNSQKQHTNHNTQKQENISLSHVGKITCTLCQKQFSDEASLKQHMGSSVHKTVPSFGFPIDNNSQKQHTNHNTQKQENISSVSDVGQEVGSSKQRKINCTLCHKQFSDEASLKQHMGSSAHKTVPSSTFGFPIDKNPNTQDRENISSVCEVQSKPTNIMNQDSGGCGDKKNKCTICQKEFAAPKDLQQHLDSSIHGTKSICCNECGSMFLTLKSLEDHLNSPRHQSIECSTCMRIFASKDALDQHLENSKVHKEMVALNSVPKNNETHSESFLSERDITCYVCQAVFTTNSALKQHMNATGHTELNNICEVCNGSFKSKNLLDQHMRDEHNHVYTCSTCIKQFGTEQDVVQHIQAVHKNYSYFCPVCDKMFYYEFSLKDHMKKTGHAYSESICTICFATFSSENALEQHLNNTSHKYVH